VVTVPTKGSSRNLRCFSFNVAISLLSLSALG
jgi:hypothetical protein